MNLNPPAQGHHGQHRQPRLLGPAVLLAAVLAPAPLSAALVDQWRAADITDVVDGGEVWRWDTANNRTAWAGSIDLPTFQSGVTPAGGPVLRFQHAMLQVDPPDNPVGGLSEFTMAVVLKINTPSAAPGGGQWYQNTPIIDANQDGETADWGTAVTPEGAFGFGAGNPDTTVFSSGASVNDDKFHTLIVTWKAGETLKLLLDNWDPIAAAGAIPAEPRNAALLAFGGAVAQAPAEALVSADIAEIRFHDNAFTDAEALALANELATEHGVQFERLILDFATDKTDLNAGESATLSWQVAPDATLRLEPGFGNVDDQTTDGVGQLEVTPANDTTYTLWAVRDTITNHAEVTLTVHRPAADALVDVWDAASAGEGEVTDWTSEQGRHARQVAPLSAPTLLANATPAGGPAVQFANALLEVAANDNPLKDATEATVAYVVRIDTAPTRNEGAQWWQQTGILNSRTEDGQNSWGSSLDAEGEAGFGVGNPDVTVQSTGGSLADEQFHLVLQTWSRSGVTIQVDDRPPVEFSGAVPALPRDALPLRLGGLAADVPNALLAGQLAEIRFYDEALVPAELDTIRADLQAKHGLGGGGKPVPPFSILDQGFNPDGAWFVTFESVPGVRYTLQFTSDLVGQPWQDLTSLVAGGDQSTLLDAAATGRHGWYRVVADANSGGGKPVPPFSILDQGFNGDGAWFVTFESVPGVRYTLQFASDLVGQPWQDLTSLVAGGDRSTLLDAAATGRHGWYRVVADASSGGELEPFAILRGGFNGPTESFVVVQSVAGHTYTLLKRPALGAGEWQGVATVTATGEETTLTDPNATDPNAFYRVRGE